NLPLIVTEGEKKTLALYRLSWHRFGEAAERPDFLPAGLAGVDAWRTKIGKESGSNGESVDVKGPLPDFDLISWKTRRVLILFDVNVREKERVQLARKFLTKELESRGAIVSWFEWPEEIPEGINGIDDYLARVGPDKVL